jgi:hypothetical protein
MNNLVNLCLGFHSESLLYDFSSQEYTQTSCHMICFTPSDYHVVTKTFSSLAELQKDFLSLPFMTTGSQSPVSSVM